jgi:hypothetical protein
MSTRLQQTVGFNRYRLERFDWQSPDASASMTIKVTEMLADIAAHKLVYEAVTTHVDDKFAHTWLTQRSLNMHHIKRLTPERLAQPVLGITMPDATVLLIDGSHRYAARWIKHMPTVDYHLVRDPLWRPYATIRGDL